MSPGPTRKGFTAFELVVVLAIISVLALLALPAVGVANRKAKLNEAIGAVQRLHRQAIVASRQYLLTYGVAPTSIHLAVVSAGTATLRVNGNDVESFQPAPTVYASGVDTITYAIGTSSYPGTGETTNSGNTWRTLTFASLDNQLSSSITIYRFGAVYVQPPQ